MPAIAEKQGTVTDFREETVPDLPPIYGGGGGISCVPGEPRLRCCPALRRPQDRQQQAIRCRAEMATPPRLTSENKFNYRHITLHLV